MSAMMKLLRYLNLLLLVCSCAGWAEDGKPPKVPGKPSETSSLEQRVDAG
jgi:hypothetical protein